MKSYKLTVVGIITSTFIFINVLIFDLDIFEHLSKLLEKLEDYEVDELLISLFVFLCFFTADIIKRNWHQKTELEKLKIFKAMIASTHHILNNFLNQMQLFRLTAQETPNFDKRTLLLYDEVIEKAQNQIQTLSDITEISESSIHEATSPK